MPFSTCKHAAGGGLGCADSAVAVRGRMRGGGGGAPGWGRACSRRPRRRSACGRPGPSAASAVRESTQVREHRIRFSKGVEVVCEKVRASSVGSENLTGRQKVSGRHLVRKARASSARWTHKAFGPVIKHHGSSPMHKWLLDVRNYQSKKLLKSSIPIISPLPLYVSHNVLRGISLTFAAAHSWHTIPVNINKQPAVA